MQTALLPAVGDPAWFYPRPGDPHMIVHRTGALVQPLAAWVLYVHDSRTVDVRIWDHVGKEFFRKDVQVAQHSDAVKGWDFVVLRPKIQASVVLP